MTKDVKVGLFGGIAGVGRQKGPTYTIVTSDRTTGFFATTLKAKKATKATEAAIREFVARRAELEKLEAEKLALAQSRASELAGRLVIIRRDADPGELVVPPITNFDIAASLQSSQFDVSKAQVRLPYGPIKSFGTHLIQIALHRDVIVEITLEVQKESQESLNQTTDTAQLATTDVAIAIRDAEVAASRMCQRMDEVLSFMATSEERIARAREAVRAELAAEYGRAQ